MQEFADRFTERAHRVLNYAKDEALFFQHPHIGSEHLLLGLVRDKQSITGRVMAELGVHHPQARSAVEFVAGRGEGIAEQQLALTAGMQQIFVAAAEEAERYNHRSIGPEHLLLGLIRGGDNIACKVLEILGVSLESVRTLVVRTLGGSEGDEAVGVS